MPWKGEKDPYKIWLSEIILQQTRVEQGLGYYKNFVKTFPNIHRLANESDEKIFKMWEGLGYYSRCKNLINTARFISNELNGKFPSTYEEIKKLKGVGPYTAAAISSFAFNLPYAVVDGNVQRVLARFFGIDVAVDSQQGKKLFSSLADELLDKKNPGIYNQAIMDFGAIICKPLSPGCANCPLKRNCIAFKENRIKSLPVKSKKIKIEKRWFNYLVVEFRDTILIRQRTEKDIWQNLFEFVLIETERPEEGKSIIKRAIRTNLITAKEIMSVNESPTYKQRLSHQLIHALFTRIKINRKIKVLPGWFWVKKSQVSNYAFPNIINQYLLENPVDPEHKISIS
jgi:A/G-specific adenine glycosylase